MTTLDQQFEALLSKQAGEVFTRARPFEDWMREAEGIANRLGISTTDLPRGQEARVAWQAGGRPKDFVDHYLGGHERESRKQAANDDLVSTLLALPDGGQVDLSGYGLDFTVTYYEEQAYGDDNRPVRGATTGEYIIEESGRDLPVKRVHVSPETGGGSRRYAAEQVAEFVTTRFMRGRFSSRKTAVKTQDGFEVEPGSGDRVYFAVYPSGDTWQSIGPFATLQWASDHAGPAGFVVKSDFGVVASRKQAQDGNPYGGGDRANPYFDPGPSQQSGPSYVPAPEEVTRPVTTRPRGGGDAGPDIEDQDTFTEDGQGFDMTEDRSPEQQSAPAAAQASLDKVAVRCGDCGQHGKLALSKVNDDLACRCGSTNVDLDDLVPDPDRLALNAIARDIRKANPDLEPERVGTLAKRAHGLSKGAAWELVTSSPHREGDDVRFEWGIGKYRLVAEGREGRKYDDTWTWRIEEQGTRNDVAGPVPYTTIAEGTANGESEAMRKAEEAFDFDETAPTGH